MYPYKSFRAYEACFRVDGAGEGVDGVYVRCEWVRIFSVEIVEGVGGVVAAVRGDQGRSIRRGTSSTERI